MRLFIRQHYIRFCICIAFSLAMPAIAANAESITPLAPAAAHARALDQTLLIIDVRQPGEWAETGMPANAAGATLQPGGDNQEFLAQIQTITRGNKNAPIGLICARGVRSDRAAQMLAAAGYTSIFDIQGGMLGNSRQSGWLDQNLPTK